jgi:type II secretory pathway pseudopilin PulG
MTRRAFTLLEILIVVVILGGLIVVVFSVFAVGVSGFKLGTTRLDLQSELRRILNPMRQDLRNSSFQSTSFISVPRNVPLHPPNTQPVTPVHRDGLCFNGLQKLLDDGSYDSNGFPRWDCYIVYFATLDEPDGKMVRMALQDNDVPPDDVLSVPRSLATSDLSLTNPELLQGNVRVLSNQVMDFEVATDQGNQLITLKLRLRGKAGHQNMGGRSTAEILEIHTAVRPANTWPRL